MILNYFVCVISGDDFLLPLIFCGSFPFFMLRFEEEEVEMMNRGNRGEEATEEEEKEVTEKGRYKEEDKHIGDEDDAQRS